MSEDYDIVQEMEHYKIEDGEIKDLGKTYVPTYMTVASFASLCQMFTETDVAMMAATLAINKVD